MYRIQFGLTDTAPLVCIVTPQEVLISAPWVDAAQTPVQYLMNDAAYVPTANA